jgi:2'-5' RNA ligase
MQRRIFVAINLPESIKLKLQKSQQEWSDLPVRFTKKNSLHFTLLFIGHVLDEQMLGICQKIREIAKKHQPFELEFGRVCLAPPNKPSRLIWIEGERNEALINLKRDIEGMMVFREGDSRAFAEIERELKIFVPHITLARIRQMAWKKLDEKPVINKDILISVPVNSIDVMESNLKPSYTKASEGRHDGVEYVILESAGLG